MAKFDAKTCPSFGPTFGGATLTGFNSTFARLCRENMILKKHGLNLAKILTLEQLSASIAFAKLTASALA